MKSENDARIRNLVSAIGDATWHEFYLIGQDFYTIGKNNRVEYDAFILRVEEDLFGGWKGIYHHAHPGCGETGMTVLVRISGAKRRKMIA